MARKKVTLGWIANDAARRATLKKRLCGLLKKVRELSILCDVPACAVVYGPENPKPEVWPLEADARQILRHFLSMPVSEQAKKRVDQEGFIFQRMAKLEEQIRRRQRDNRELEMKIMMYQATAGSCLQNLRMDQAGILERLIEEKARAVRARIEALQAEGKVVDRDMATMDKWIIPIEVGNLNSNANPGQNTCTRPSPNPGFGDEQKLGLGFYGAGGGYVLNVSMQAQQPCMGMGMMEFGGPSSSWVDYPSSSTSFYPFPDF